MVYFGNYPASIGQFIPERPHVSSPPPSISQGRPVQSSAASIIEVDGPLCIYHEVEAGPSATRYDGVDREAKRKLPDNRKPFDVGRDLDR
jgi:hypothetical protein